MSSVMPSASEDDTMTTKTKNRGFASILKSILLMGTCFVALLLRTHSSHSSPHIILDKIYQLNRDLNAIEYLKKQYIQDEIEIKVDRQRINELEQQIKSMRQGFEKTTTFFSHQKDALASANVHIQDALATSTKLNDEMREERVHEMQKLSRDISNTRNEMNEEKEENLELRRLLGEMKEELEKRKGLRGHTRAKTDGVAHLDSKTDA